MTTLTDRSTKGSALSHAELDANFARDVQTETTGVTFDLTDNRSYVLSNGSSLTHTLPTLASALASDTGDYTITIRNIASTSCTIDGNGAETIEGAANYVLATDATVTLVAVSGDWKVVHVAQSVSAAFQANREAIGIYVGQFSRLGATVELPSGWSVARNGDGDYTMTHNLGDTDYQVVAGCFGGPSGSTLGSTAVSISKTTTTTDIHTFSSSTGSQDDPALGVMFILTRW